MSKVSQYQDASNNPDLQSYFDLSEKIAGLYQSRRLSLLQLKNYLESNISIDFSQITGYTPYTLPIADSSTLGGVKVGSGLNVAVDGTISVAPATSYEEVVNFSTLTPADPGVVFTPNTPATTGLLYLSDVDGSTWIYDGSIYVTPTPSLSGGTAFNLLNTTTDAGASKTASIERSGRVYIKTDNSNYLELSQQVVSNVSSQSATQTIIVGSNISTDHPSRVMSRHRGTPSSPFYTQLDDIIAADRHVSTNAICYEVQTIAAENHSATISGSKTIFKTIPLGTNIPEEILQFTENGKLKFNGAYQFPNVDGTAGQYLATTGLGTLAWTSLPPASALSGSGLNNYVARWNPNSTTLTYGVIEDDGTTVGIGGIEANSLLNLETSSVTRNLLITNTRTLGGIGIQANISGASTSNNIGIWSNTFNSSKSNTAGLFRSVATTTPSVSDYNLGIEATVGGTLGLSLGTNTAVRALVTSTGGITNPSNKAIEAIVSSINTANDNIGVYSEVKSFSGGGSRYATQLIDGTEGIGKFLKSVTPDGKANWGYTLHAAQVMCSDLDTAITADAVNKKGYWTAPADGTITEVFADLDTAQASGSLFTVDIKKNGVSIFSTLLTFDNTELTTLTATTAATLAATISFVKGDRFAVYVTQVGDGTAKGLLATINYERKS